MTKLDKQSIQSKLARLRKNIAELKKISKVPDKTYQQDFLLTSSTERLLQISIQLMLDMGSHIIASQALGEPLEYRDIFAILVKSKIIPKTLEKSLKNLTGLRNRLVHAYDEIDHVLLHGYLKNNLKDIESFILYITKALDIKIS